MQRLVVAVTLALFVGLSGCAEARRASRNPETDALLQAARGGHAEAVKSILASGRADVNGKDEHGDTPLIVAARGPRRNHTPTQAGGCVAVTYTLSK